MSFLKKLFIVAILVWGLDKYRSKRVEDELAKKRKTRANDKNVPSVIVVGAGFSGLCSAIKLGQAGIPYIVLEKGTDVGGTWLHNTYPGVACDVPSHGYSFSFELNDWSTSFSPGPEILAYCQKVAKKYDVYPHCQFGAEVGKCEWDESTHEWSVTYKQNNVTKTIRSRFLFSGAGGLHIPSYPNIKGRGSLKGKEMHSSEWDDSVDLTDKNVVVVGSAASAVQIVPAIADKVKHLTVVQRTPNWLAPQRSPVLPPGLKYSDFVRFLLRNVPGLARLHRWMVYLSMESVFYPLGALSNGDWGWGNKVTKKTLTLYMKHFLNGNKELEEKVIPKFAPFCKRVIRSEKFLPAIQKPNVTLNTDALTQVESDGLRFSTGELVPADVVIWATGYKVGNFGNLAITTKDVCVTGDVMAQSPGLKTLHGIVSPQVPNGFIMLGPNTGLGHNSIIILIETQVEYAVKCIELMMETGATKCTVKQEVADEWCRRVDKAMETSVWKAGGCQSWYQSGDGKINVLYPWSTAQYMYEAYPPSSMKDFDLSTLKTFEKDSSPANRL